VIILLNDELMHWGVKGMRWGYRKSPAAIAAKEAKRVEKEDYKWGKTLGARKTHIKAFNAAAEKMNTGEIERINAKYKGKNVDDPNSPIGKQYYKDFSDTFAKHYSNSLRSQLGGDHAPSKQFKYEVHYDMMNEFAPRVYMVDKSNNQRVGVVGIGQ